MKKWVLAVATVVLSAAMFTACGKRTDNASPSVTEVVSESEVSTSTKEETPEENPIEEEYFLNGEAVNEYVFKKTRETLIAEGKLSADETLLYNDSRDFEEEPYESYFGEDREGTDEVTFFTLGENGIDKTFVSEYDYHVYQDKGFTVQDVRTISLKEYEIEHKDDEYAYVVPYTYSYAIDARLCELRTTSIDELKAFIDKMNTAYGLNRDSKVYDYIRLKAANPEILKTPEGAAGLLLPFLKAEGFRYEPFTVRQGALIITDDTGERMMAVRAIDRDEAGDYLYTIGTIVYNYEDEIEARELLENATPESLANAYDSYENCQNDYNSATGEPSVDTDFFFAGEADGGKAKLYGLCEHTGYLLWLDGKTYPLGTDVGMDDVRTFEAYDYDGDGAKEYAFTLNDGRGTGFFTEELFVVDPNSDRVLTQFDENFDMHSGGQCPYDLVKYEIDETGVMKAWMEQDGRKVSEISLSDKVGVTGIIFGDIFVIYPEGEKWFFETKCGMYTDEVPWAEYENSFMIRGELHYRDGVVTYDNLGLYTDGGHF